MGGFSAKVDLLRYVLFPVALKLDLLTDHVGKILQDSNTVESYKIEEKGFIVCMISKVCSYLCPIPARSSPPCSQKQLQPHLPLLRKPPLLRPRSLHPLPRLLLRLHNQVYSQVACLLHLRLRVLPLPPQPPQRPPLLSMRALVWPWAQSELHRLRRWRAWVLRDLRSTLLCVPPSTTRNVLLNTS
jgi:hypothetical protein